MSLIQLIPDGIGFSPDGGHFDKVGTLMYWSDGSITEQRPGCYFRIGWAGVTNGERYSQWTPEKRAEVCAETKRCRDEWEREVAERMKIHTALLESAKAKLTEDEYNAVLVEGRD